MFPPPHPSLRTNPQDTPCAVHALCGTGLSCRELAGRGGQGRTLPDLYEMKRPRRGVQWPCVHHAHTRHTIRKRQLQRPQHVRVLLRRRERNAPQLGVMMISSYDQLEY
jgi:hypothetical protein